MIETPTLTSSSSAIPTPRTSGCPVSTVPASSTTPSRKSSYSAPATTVAPSSEKVDYVSASASSPEGFTRRNKEVIVVTPMARMELSRGSGRLELASVHQGHTLEEVRDNTGFDLPIKGSTAGAPMTPSISDQELYLLRTTVKARMIETNTYPHDARTKIREP